MPEADGQDIPSAQDLAWPTLRAIRELGDSARIEEIHEKVVAIEGFSEEQQQIAQGGQDTRTRLNYRLAWARTILKNVGALENSARGVWHLTDVGRDINKPALEQAIRSLKFDSDDSDVDERAAAVAATAEDWITETLGLLRSLDPTAFERLALRLLREAGFDDLQHSGGSHDGGIDGTGVYRVSLVSFRVYFQCKRWGSAVSSPQVRDFRGAMEGRGERGLLITTSSFTSAASIEASREGARAIDLIDGEMLCRLLAEHGLGVTRAVRTEYVYAVDPEFFTGL